MRKGFLALFTMMALIFVLVGCDTGIPGIENIPGNTESLSPPSWTIGTWDLEAGDTLISSLTFSSDNVVWTATSMGFDLKEMSGTSGVALSDENVSTSVYKITMTGEGVTQTYTFTKTGATTLTFTLSTNGVATILSGFEKR